MTERDVFIAALNLPAGPECKAFLDDDCGTDTALRRQEDLACDN
jgi:hypothetical protein